MGKLDPGEIVLGSAAQAGQIDAETSPRARPRRCARGAFVVRATLGARPPDGQIAQSGVPAPLAIATDALAARREVDAAIARIERGVGASTSS